MRKFFLDMRPFFVLSILFAVGFSLPWIAFAAGSQSDDISWVLPTQRVDGAALLPDELASTEIEVSKDGVVLDVVSVPSPGTTYTWNRELPPNYTLCYRARVTDTEGLQSEWTGEVCKTVKGQPNPPGQLDAK